VHGSYHNTIKALKRFFSKERKKVHPQHKNWSQSYVHCIYNSNTGVVEAYGVLQIG
jgi:hypothetical protein